MAARLSNAYISLLWKCLCSLLIWVFLSFISVPIFIVVFSVRFVSSKLVPLIYPGVTKIFSTLNAHLAFREHENILQVVLGFGFEGKIELEDLRSTFQSRVIQKKKADGELQWPELQQFIVHKFGYPFWKWDKSFNIQKHIRLLRFDNKSGLNPQDILDIIEGRLLHKPFPAKKSPWELLLVPNFQDTPKYGTEVDEGRVGTLLLFHYHHGFGDGASVAKIFDELFNGDKRIGNILFPNKCSFRYSSIWNTLGLYFFGPYDMVSSGNMATKYGWSQKTKIMKYNAAMTPTIPLEMIKNIRKVNNAAFSAVVLVAVGNALYRYMKEAGYEPPETLCYILPRRVKHRPLITLTNHMTVAMIPLPMQSDTKQLGGVQVTINSATESRAPEMFFRMCKVLGGLWTPVMEKLSNLDSGDAGTIFTNLNLYDDEKRFKGENKLRFVFGRGRQRTGGNGIILISAGCKEGLRLLIQIDEGVVSKDKLHAQVFIKYFLEELQLMSESTNVNNHAMIP